MKAKDFFKILKIVGIGLSECVIIIFMYVPLVFLFDFFASKLNFHFLLFSDFYQNPYTLIFMTFLYLTIGIILFALFKLIEVKYISKHKKDSYQYMLVPIFILILWEIIYNVINIYGGNKIVLVWFPLYTVVLILNLLYEFILIKKVKEHQKS